MCCMPNNAATTTPWNSIETKNDDGLLWMEGESENNVMVVEDIMIGRESYCANCPVF
jgi:hypothetical protein